MTYYIIEETYRIYQNGTQELREKNTFPLNDIEGNALALAEKRFYARLASDLEMEELMNGVIDSTQEMLYQQVWYADKACTIPLLRLSITESQLMRNLEIGTPRGNTECEYTLAGAVKLGEAIVPNKFTDVHITRERLYRNRDGIYFIETSLQTNNVTLKWESNVQAISPVEARNWGKAHMNRMEFEQCFGSIQPDDDREPMVIMMRKDFATKMNQVTRTTGKQPSVIIEEALNDYLANY